MIIDESAARANENLMPYIAEAVRSECTVGEIVSTLKKTFSEQGF